MLAGVLNKLYRGMSDERRSHTFWLVAETTLVEFVIVVVILVFLFCFFF